MKGTMRVLHVFDSYLATTENWAFNLINHLPNTQVVIAARDFLKSNFYSPRFAYLEFPLSICRNPQRPLWLRATNKITSEILRLYPWYVGKTAGRCDLIHSHFAMVGWQYMDLAVRLRVPHIVSFYGLDYEHVPFLQPVWEKRYQKLFQIANLFLCEGAHGAEILHRIGCPSEKIAVARLGVDVDHIPFSCRSKNPGELRLLQIASFTEKKGHKYTIEAFVTALRSCPNMTLTLIGGDRYGVRSRLQEQTRNADAQDKVFFLDAIDFDQLHTVMKHYHLFIHPSCYTDQKDCEGGAPIVLLDAQATGMPVISTTHCDIPDEVIHGKTGLLSPEKDSIDLAKSIEIFYNMKQNEYNLFARSARSHVTEHYNVKTNAEKIKEIYDNFLLTFKG